MAARTRGVLPVSCAHSLTPDAAAAWRRAGWLPPIGGAQDPDPDPADGKPAGAPDPAAGGGNVEIPEGAKNPDAVQRAIQQERDARAAAEKRAKDAEAKLAEQAEADKTEAEKTAERLAELERKSAEAERRAVLAETAQAQGVPADILAGPNSTSPEDLAAHAERVKAFATAQQQQQTETPGAKPVGDGGARPRPTEASASEMRRLAREDPAEFNRRFDAGEVPAGALGGS